MREIKLKLTENQYIDLVEAIDMALSIIIHRTKNTFKQSTIKPVKDLQQKLFDQFVQEYDSYMTIRAMVVKEK